MAGVAFACGVICIAVTGHFVPRTFAAFSSVRSFAASSVASVLHASIDTFAPIDAVDGGVGTAETIPMDGGDVDGEAMADGASIAANPPLNGATMDASSDTAPHGVGGAPASTGSPSVIREDPARSIPVIIPRSAPLGASSPSASTSSSSSASILPPRPSCAFPSSSYFSDMPSGPTIAINEIAWMGVPSVAVPPGTDAANAEWMELHNDSHDSVSLAGWTVADASGKIAVRFDAHDRIDGGGMLLLVRGSTTFPYAHVPQVAYAGALKNSGDDVAVFDPSCAISDAVFAAESGWPAGDASSKRTMERDADGDGWHTSVAAGGTPGEANTVPQPSHYAVTISFTGVGGATVTSVPKGLACTATGCSGTFATGDSITLTAHPASGAVFDGWSGACAGSHACTLVVAGDMSVIAGFHIPRDGDGSTDMSVAIASSSASASTSIASVIAVSASTSVATSSVAPAFFPSNLSSSISSSPSSSFDAVDVHIVAAQIAGDASSNDFVKLYNAGAASVDMSGWKLRKRSRSGADYSLRTFPDGTSLAADDYFLWANSEGDFASSIGANISSTETLAADNSIALFDADGNEVDALAWGDGEEQYGEGDPFPSNPDAGRTLSRLRARGVFVDTRNNATDFIIE